MKPLLYKIPFKLKTIAIERGPLGIVFLPFDFIINKTLSFFFTRKTLLHLNAIDVYIRYNTIAQQISPLEKNILEVGGANTALQEFLHHPHMLTVIDKDKEYKASKKITYILNSRAKIPFSDNYFDCVISVAMLEHLPRHQREAFIKEWKRVARKIHLYVPFGEAGRKYDTYLFITKKCLGIHDKWTEEHIKYGLPTIQELQTYFPKARMRVIQNGNVWLVTTLITCLPIIGRVLPGIAYFLLTPFETREPHIGIVLSWEK